MHVAVVAVAALGAEPVVGSEELQRYAQSHLLAHAVAHLVDGSGELASSHGCLCHDLLKRAEAVVEGALAASAHKGETGLQRPLAGVVGILERRDDGREGLALELAWCGGVLGVVGEQRVIVLDSAVLVSQLPVDGQVMSLAHESHAGRVVINAVDADRSLTAHHAVESDVLVGVGQQTTCHGGMCRKCGKGTHGPSLFCHF